MKTTILVMIPFCALVFWYHIEEDEPGILKYLIIAAIFALWGSAYLFERIANKRLAGVIWNLDKEKRNELLADLDPKQRKKIEKMIERRIKNQSCHTTPTSAPR